MACGPCTSSRWWPPEESLRCTTSAMDSGRDKRFRAYRVDQKSVVWSCVLTHIDRRADAQDPCGRFARHSLRCCVRRKSCALLDEPTSSSYLERDFAKAASVTLSADLILGIDLRRLVLLQSKGPRTPGPLRASSSSFGPAGQDLLPDLPILRNVDLEGRRQRVRELANARDALFIGTGSMMASATPTSAR